MNGAVARQLNPVNLRQEWIDRDSGILRVRGSTIPEAARKIQLASPLSPEEADAYPSEMKDLATTITGTIDVISEPLSAIEKISDWVSNNISDSISLKQTTPVETLSSKRGDKNDRTELFVALARSARIPAKTVTGLAYDRGAFFLRDWVLIKLSDDLEIEIDPARNGQFVDARYVRLSEAVDLNEGKLAWTLTNLDISVQQNENP